MSVRKAKRQKELAKKREARANKEARAVFRYMITLAYDGSRYGGYAKQSHGNTIQNKLEAALADYFKEEAKTINASRTDAFVYALDQKVSFDWNEKLPLRKVKNVLNEMLLNDIVILDIEEVSADFHVRHQVVEKTYEYTIITEIDPRRRNDAWHVPEVLNVDAMREASRCLVGTHDFATFRSAKATTDDSIRTIYRLDVEQIGREIKITVTGNGFLYNMVRLIVKSMVDVGSGRQEVDYIEVLLDLKRKPDNLESAPALGLCLMEIKY